MRRATPPRQRPTTVTVSNPRRHHGPGRDHYRASGGRDGLGHGSDGAATATDSVGVVGVQFKLDGANVGAEDTATPYSLSWNSATASAGAHQFTAVARDAAGNSATSASLAVTVAVQSAGLVAAYSFDEATGTTAADGSGNGNNGTLVNGTTWSTSAKFGGAANFDGVNDRIDVPDSASLDLTTGMTLEAWVRPAASNAYRTVALKEVSESCRMDSIRRIRTTVRGLLAGCGSIAVRVLLMAPLPCRSMSIRTLP